MFSVIIPLYNKKNSIFRAIDSVLNQTFKDYELIVVDDGSTDGSAEMVVSYYGSRIKLIRQLNGGASAARNKGIKNAINEFVTFLDADDEWEPNFLEEVSKLISLYPSAIVYGTNYCLKDYKGNRFNTVIKGLTFENSQGIIRNYFEVASISSPPICSICVAMKRKNLLDWGGFPIGIKSGEDLLTWARLLVNGDLAYSTKPLAIYNLAEGYEYGAEPVRRQDSGDPVGKELERLYDKHKDTIGLRQYISHWHKMRASVAIRFGEKRETLYESFVSLKYNIFNYKVIPFIILALLPPTLRNKIIRMKNH